MEQQILTDVADLIKTTNKGIDSGVEELDVREMIEMRVGSIINVLLLGYRFDESRVDEFKIVKDRISKHTRNVGSPMFRMTQSNVKFFKHIPACKKFLQTVHSNIEELMIFFNKQVEEHLKELDLDDDSQPTDFVHAYLQHHHRMEDKQRFGYCICCYSRILMLICFSRYDMLNVIFDLWLAGQETTRSLLQLLNYSS
jgi:cytochrome P450 family 33